MITKEDYINLKEMWDYQRMLEYNKEQLMNKISSLLDNTFISDVTEEEMFEVFWNKIKERDKFEEPPKAWIPKNEKLRLWNE
mgnify:FL=1